MNSCKGKKMLYDELNHVCRADEHKHRKFQKVLEIRLGEIW